MIKTIPLLLFTLFITACGVKITSNLFTTNKYMVVSYSSQGCFHHRSNILVFHETNVTIYKTMNEWNQKVAKTKMGTLLLSQQDKVRLNKLFSYYDGKVQSACTTIDTIDIKRYRNEKLIFTKNIRDASCGQYGKKNELGFSELINRVIKKKTEILAFDFSTIYTDKVLKNKVSSIISKMLDKEISNKAYADLEKLGTKATPYIIMQMDDFRELPVSSMSLKNKNRHAFEGIRHIGVKKVTDVLSEILTQLEGMRFSYISSAEKSEEDRKRDIYEWRAWLLKTKNVY